MKRFMFAAVVTLFAPVHVDAQIPVIDPGNLAQAVLIAERTLREYELLQQQYETLTRMSTGLGNMERYRLPVTPGVSHDAARWPYGRALLDALNHGDPAMASFGAVTRPLQPSALALDRLPAEARRALHSAYATVDMTDALSQAAGHDIGTSRVYAQQLERAIVALQADVTNPASEFHELTAILDKVAAGALIGRRQDSVANDLLARTLEQILARSKRARDTEAATMNMRLGGMRDGRAAGDSIVRGAADDLRTWRQP
jgi:hypothetical protein